MKKIQTILLVAFLALAFAMGSFKKDEPAVSSEQVETTPAVTPPANAEKKVLLTKKWFFVSYSQRGPSGTVDTKTTNWGTNYVEFKGENSFEDTYYFKTTGTYTLNADGTQFTAVNPNSISINITTLTATSLVYNFVQSGTTRTFTLSSQNP